MADFAFCCPNGESRMRTFYKRIEIGIIVSKVVVFFSLAHPLSSFIFPHFTQNGIFVEWKMAASAMGAKPKNGRKIVRRLQRVPRH